MNGVFFYSILTVVPQSKCWVIEHLTRKTGFIAAAIVHNFRQLAEAMSQVASDFEGILC